MSKIIKVTLEYEDRISYIEGQEAEQWLKNADACATILAVHNMNPFDKRPTKWNVIIKEDNSKQENRTI